MTSTRPRMNFYYQPYQLAMVIFINSGSEKQSQASHFSPKELATPRLQCITQPAITCDSALGF